MQHQNISHESLTKLNIAYLHYIFQYMPVRNNDLSNFANYNLDNNLLGLNDSNQVLKLNIYNAIIFSLSLGHGLRPHNRKFYWNAINNYFEPIYYDGYDFLDGSNINYNPYYLTFPKNDYFLFGIIEAKKKIKKIKFEDFFNKVQSRGLTLTKDKVKKKLDKIVLNLNNIESRINNNAIKIQNRNHSLDEKSWSNYINNSLKISSDIDLIVRNSKNNSFLACNNLQLKCI